MIVQSASSAFPVKTQASIPAISASRTANSSASYTVSLSPASQIPPLPGAVAPPDPTGITGKLYWTANDFMADEHNNRAMAEIDAKMRNHVILTSSEMDYLQTTRGDLRTIASLSPAERSLYDKLAAAGNTKALAALNRIAFVRAASGHSAGYGGGSYDPINTPITPDNIKKYFMNSFQNPSKDTLSDFTALADYLKSNPIA